MYFKVYFFFKGKYPFTGELYNWQDDGILITIARWHPSPTPIQKRFPAQTAEWFYYYLDSIIKSDDDTHLNAIQLHKRLSKIMSHSLLCRHHSLGNTSRYRKCLQPRKYSPTIQIYLTFRKASKGTNLQGRIL